MRIFEVSLGQGRVRGVKRGKKNQVEIFLFHVPKSFLKLIYIQFLHISTRLIHNIFFERNKYYKVPVSDNPTSLKLFRPISLCPVIYKTITKLLANRLKAIMPKLFGPSQTSFVLGRHIMENIVIAQEVIHSMRRKKGRIGQMAIKVDLEKAYDQLIWDFIYETLWEIGLPTEFIRLIMECITIATMQLQ